MIKIIKEGHKQFQGTCFKCGCEYTYELEDIKDDCVKCPQCGAFNTHMPRANVILPPPDPYIGQLKVQFDVKDNNQYNNPCGTCSYYQRLKAGEIYVGDTPCTWCQYNPFRVTCTNVYTATSTNTDVTIDTGEMEYGGIEFNNGKN